jgi:O-acetyl-ADP-ribose deacetylase (regulator of RNase III)
VAEIEVKQADITKLDVDAIANAANTELRHGGGVAGAISGAGGLEHVVFAVHGKDAEAAFNTAMS